MTRVNRLAAVLAASRSPVVYHMTYFRNLDGIANQGLDYQVQGGANFDKPHLSQNSTQGTFFTTDQEQAANWLHHLDYQAQARSDEMLEDGLVPVLLRFRLNAKKHQEDPESEHPNSFFTQTVIDPRGIEMWSGKGWIPVDEFENVPPETFMSFVDDYPDEEYWEVADPYPLPK